MKRIALVSITAAALSVSALPGAFAADLPVKAVPMATIAAYNWSGCYIGGNAGWVRSTSNTRLTGTDTDGGGFGAELADGSTPTTFGTRFNGFIGGGQIGCNWQNANIVWGIEGDFDWSGASASATQTNLPQPPFPARAAITTTMSNKLNWLSTVRLRAGLPVANNWLLYVTGGLAVADTEVSASSTCPTCGPPRAVASTNTKTGFGWVLGLGAEWALNAKWSVKGEGLYYNVGNNSTGLVYNYGANTSTLTATTRENGWILRGGLNFKL